MKAINRNAAETLFDKVESLSNEYHDSWRCIYLKLSDKHARYNAELRTNFIDKAIIELLSEDDGYIFLCDDGDIFVLFQGALSPIVAKLSAHFGDLNPGQLRGQPADNLFIFFDLGRHWHGFYNLCRAKSSHTPPIELEPAYQPKPQRTAASNAQW